MSVEVLKIRIPNRRISWVEHYQHAALVNFDTGLPSYTSFQFIPATRRFVAAAEAMHCYQKIVSNAGAGKNNQHRAPVFHQECPVWYRPFYADQKGTVETGTFNILPLRLASDVPIRYQHIAFFVGKDYAYVFTQDPKNNLLYCTVCDRKDFEGAVWGDCWQPADVIQNPFNNPFEKNSFNTIVLRQSKSYLPMALRKKLQEHIKS